jgi:hypothetical protein
MKTFRNNSGSIRSILTFVGLTLCAVTMVGCHTSNFNDASLVGYWKFDEASGVKAIDNSGRGNHGTLKGATRTAGKISGGVDCKQDAFVEITHSSTLDNLQNGLTVMAWVNRTADSSWNTVISREIKDGPSEYFGLAIVKNKALFSMDPDGAHYKNIKSAEDMPIGKWIHLAGTYDNSEFKLYVNGKLVNSQKMDIPTRQDDENPVIIGGNTNTRGKVWVDCFHGKIDDVRFYNKALTAVQIAGMAIGK